MITKEVGNSLFWGQTPLLSKVPNVFTFLGTEKQAPPGLTPSLVRLPSKILKVEFPTCHVTAMALKTGLFVHR